MYREWPQAPHIFFFFFPSIYDFCAENLAFKVKTYKESVNRISGGFFLSKYYFHIIFRYPLWGKYTLEVACIICQNSETPVTANSSKLHLMADGLNYWLL